MTAVDPTRAPRAAAEAPDAAPRGAAAFADPAPLGLAAFALTTFVLSFNNTGLFKAEPVVFGLALAYGGIAQMLAGMWEFAKGNTFGATAFTSFGAFWIAFWYLTGHTDLSGVDAKDASHGVGLFLLAWAIFTAYMFLASLRTSGALIGVFGLLTITFLLLALADLTDTPNLAKAGGWFGIATALVAWYASFAGVLSFTNKRPVLPTGPR